MRVLVATTAGAGHFAGVLPFARACARAGHEVRVAAPASFGGTVRREGFGHEPLPDADPSALAAVFSRIPSLTMHEADDLVAQEVFGRLDLHAALPQMRRIAARWQPDVVVREPAELSSYVVAQERGVPHVQANIGLSRLDDRLLPLFETPLAEVGCDAAALRSAPRWTTVPPSFDVPAQSGSGRVSHVREPTVGDSGTAPLPEWWSGREEPLVYVTFGSVAASIGLFPVFYQGVLEQVGELPVRVLMTLGEAGEPEQLGPLPPNVHVERWWPQAQVMAHAAVVVGHGGFGTTQTALVAGVPQVVVPLFSFDQFLNAGRVAAAGIGVALVDDDAGTRSADAVAHGPQAARRLGAAVVSVIADRRIHRAAAALAAEIEALPPTSVCVSWLESMRP